MAQQAVKLPGRLLVPTGRLPWQGSGHDALKGARILFAPHYNYIAKENLLRHFMRVRADHVARARENGVHFVRGNNVSLGRDESMQGHDGVGYGDSYVIDPDGEILARTRRHVEDVLITDIEPAEPDRTWGLGRSRWSLRAFGDLARAAAVETAEEPVATSSPGSTKP